MSNNQICTDYLISKYAKASLKIKKYHSERRRRIYLFYNQNYEILHFVQNDRKGNI